MNQPWHARDPLRIFEITIIALFVIAGNEFLGVRERAIISGGQDRSRNQTVSRSARNIYNANTGTITSRAACRLPRTLSSIILRTFAAK